MSDRTPGAAFRVAVIGFGYWSPNLIRNIRNDPRAELAVICEKNTGRHEEIERSYPEIEVVRQYQDVFARADIDAIVVATVPSSHFRIAKQAIEHGKHVLVEKPLVLSAAEGEILLKLARERGVILMVDHTYLYSPAIIELRALVRSGSLGRIFSIESTRANLGLFQRDINVVWDLAPHDLSILLELIDERPTHVSVAASRTIVHPRQERGQESLAHVILRYPSGILAHIHLSWVSPVKVRQLFVFGDRGTALYDQLAPEQLNIFDQGIFLNEDDSESGPLFSYKAGEVHSVPVPQGGEDIARMLGDFFDSIRSGTQPRSSAALGLEVVRLLVAAQRSIENGGALVPISRAGHTSISLMLREWYTRLRHRY